MSNEEPKQHNNVEARVTRIETMLTLLCKHLGLDPRTGSRMAGSMEVRQPHDRRPQYP